MRVIRTVSLLGLVCLWTALGVPYAFAGPSVADLLIEGVQAMESGRPTLAKERLTSVLKTDKSNYHALVLLGQLEAGSLEGPNKAARILAAQKYFLMACVSQPHRPEANLALGQLYYQLGYIDEGDHYAKIGQDLDPSSYEAFAVLGQRYEDSGNYSAALGQYSEALKYYGFDPYFIDKRYLAAAQGGLDPYAHLQVDVDLKNKIRYYLLVPRAPDYFLLEEYRDKATALAQSRGRFELPPARFKYCAGSPAPKAEYSDLYEAFIKASTSHPLEYRVLRKELDSIRQEALKEIAGIQDPVAKAKALYMFLKQRVLKTYDLREGILAQDVLKDKKYLCLNGSILFTLIGAEAGLPVYGMITPGHAFASMDAGRRKIQIELTAEPMFGTTREEGFDVDWWKQFQVLNRVDAYGGLLGGSSHRNVGEVTPQQLTAYQFTNTLAHGLQGISSKYKEEEEYRKTLLALKIENNRDTATKLAELRARYEQEPDKLASLELRTVQRHQEKQRKLDKEIDEISRKLSREKADYLYTTGRELLRKARALAPTVEEFTEFEESAYVATAAADVAPTLGAIKDRAERRKDLFAQLAAKMRDMKLEEKVSGKDSRFLKDLVETIAAIEEKSKTIKMEEKTAWAGERETWLKAIGKMEQGLKEFPCSGELKRRLEAYLRITAGLAEQNEDQQTVTDMVKKAVSRIPESEFAREYRRKQLGS
ncbi:MAG: hypothetical protein FJ118_03940 [Deltaproteobacteria bacterium]|nr:hypothetical protein [Deltaproteobacteria bacterium]